MNSIQINSYTLRQVINGKVISFHKIECTHEDYKALCFLLMFPKENEIVKRCDLITIMGKNNETQEKFYFNKLALNTSVDNETIIYKTLQNRVYNGIRFDTIYLLNWICDVPMKNQIKQGRDFEEYITNMYKNLGYTVVKNYEKEKEDEGIDIIAHTKDEVLLIQCKNWTVPLVTQKELKEFLGSCYIFFYKYSNYRKYKKVRRVFISSAQEVSQNANKLIKDIYPFLEYKYVKF